MALVRERRQVSHLRLPIPDNKPPLPRPSFPLPLPPSSSSSSFSSTSTASSAAAATATAPATATSSISDYKKLGVLGHGNGGTVYKVEHKTTSAIYALKVIHGDSDPSVHRRTLRELQILRRTTDSPHIVRCHQIFDLPSGDIAVLMEHMDGGTLDTVLRRRADAGTQLPETLLAHVARQVLSGLAYLHAHKIVHRDIKPSNLLADRRLTTVKIADFGVSRIMARTLDPCDSYVGTCAYMSPERFDPETYGGNYDGYAGDIWSLGLTLLELYVGHFPFLSPGQRPDWATLMCAICFGDPPSLPDGASEEFRSFAGCCLQKESGKRWTAAQLLKHPFVCNTSDNKIRSIQELRSSR